MKIASLSAASFLACYPLFAQAQLERVCKDLLDALNAKTQPTLISSTQREEADEYDMPVAIGRYVLRSQVPINIGTQDVKLTRDVFQVSTIRGSVESISNISIQVPFQSAASAKEVFLALADLHKLRRYGDFVFGHDGSGPFGWASLALSDKLVAVNCPIAESDRRVYRLPNFLSNQMR